MARQHRLDHEGALHHVMTRGVEKRLIFLDDADRADFVHRLGRCVRETGMEVLAWALMPNHIHLLTRTGGTSLSRFMHKLLTGHAVRFNAMNERVGPLFQGRYKAILVQAEAYFARLVRYIHLNPVRAGIVPDVEELGRYPWTGHATILDPSLHDWQASRAIIDYFSGGDIEASGYVEYLSEPEILEDAAFDEGTFFIGPDGLLERSSTTSGALNRERHVAVLGDRSFSEELLHRLDARKGEPAARSRGLEHDAAMGIIEFVETTQRLPAGSLRRAGGDRSRSSARELACYCLVEVLGLPLTDAAGMLGVTRQGAYYAFKRYCNCLDRNNRKYCDVLEDAYTRTSRNA